jgi:hypothetical protein
MAHQREFSSPNEQFAIPEENYWAQDNVATSDPQLVYKSGKNEFYNHNFVNKIAFKTIFIKSLS